MYLVVTVSEVTMEGLENKGRRLFRWCLVELVSCDGVGMGVGDNVVRDVRKRNGIGIMRNGL